MSRRSIGLAVLISTVLALCSPRISNARTILVGKTCAGAQYPTIQQGVDNASAGDTVLICAGGLPGTGDY
jgi:hypothetical protein